MSRLKTDAIRNVNASVDGITLDTSGNVAIPNELQLADKIVHTGDTNTFIRFPAADTVSVETAGDERLRITSNGNLLLGTDTETNNIRLGNKFGIAGTTAYTGMSITNYSGTTAAYKPLFDFNRSRGTSDGSFVAVQADDGLGEIIFRGSGTSAFADAAAIRAYVDSGTGTAGNADMPGKLTFSTSKHGQASVVERLRIDSAGNFEIPYADNGTGLRQKIRFVTEANYFDEVAYISADRTAVSNAPTDLVFATGQVTAGVHERLRITSSGAVVLPDGTQGLRFGSAASQDLAIYHSGSNSHIDHFGTGNLYQDFEGDFNLRFYESAGTVRTALTVTNPNSAANPAFTISSNPATASVNSGTHAPPIIFKGAGWNTSSGSIEVGTRLQSVHNYWTGNYSSAFGQTYPDFKILIKNSDSASYVEKFVFQGNGTLRLSGGAGSGINFGNTAVSGATSVAQTLDNYEEGSFTPSNTSSATLTYTHHNQAKYTLIGNFVYFHFDFTFPTTSDTNAARFSGPLYTSQVNHGGGVCGYTTFGAPVQIHINATGIHLTENISNIYLTNAQCSGKRFIGQAMYHVS
tara:strand:- start:65 stop:1795 length:1731 start_codon:yes stop_codon:yes gene_type:complete